MQLVGRAADWFCAKSVPAKFHTMRIPVRLAMVAELGFEKDAYAVDRGGRWEGNEAARVRHNRQAKPRCIRPYSVDHELIRTGEFGPWWLALRIEMMKSLA